MRRRHGGTGLHSLSTCGNDATARCRELFPRCASCGNAGPVQAVALRLKINPDPFTPVRRSSFSHRTSVPVSFISPINGMESVLFCSKTVHLFSLATRSRSHVKAFTSPFFFDTTVSLLHCENEAVFNPRPKRPRSFKFRLHLGSVLPSLMACINSSLPSPSPSSMIAILKSSEGIARIEIFLALAVIELSTISASALLNEYPISLRLSIKILGSGSSCIDSIQSQSY